MKLPSVGVESFSKIILNNYYYVDKTGIIRDLINLKNEVTLFTRPRRFGKSLNMDMLKTFFETGSDKTLFSGLKIEQYKDICDNFQGKFPVISINLKDVDGMSFEDIINELEDVVCEEAKRFVWLMDSPELTKYDKIQLEQILLGKFKNITNLTSSLKLLTRFLRQHYGKKTIVLIDEYDVPLDKAHQNNCYDETARVIRSLFGKVLKSNKDNLEFAVITGCMRIAKESIFTGLNNFEVYSVQDEGFSEYFGFTNEETEQMLEYYGLEDKLDLFREWYDGYRFGSTEIYCPWDVINQCKRFYALGEREIKFYWKNSSSNSIVKDILNNSTDTTKEQLGILVSGGSIEQEIVPEVTYSDLDRARNQKKQIFLWSILYITGYLTDIRRPCGDKHFLVIPNKEIYEIYKKQILDWFVDETKHSGQWEELCNAIGTGNALQTERILNHLMSKYISIRDTYYRNDMKENYYHGMIIGLLLDKENWSIKSEQESGNGYADILIKINEKKTGCVFELKYAKNKEQMEDLCNKAVQQIKETGYINLLKQEGMETIYQFGISFYKKICKVICEKI